ncbi:hypothetical protein D9M70_545150 [compost metagenome]
MAEGPGHLELLDVVLVDLLQRGETLAPWRGSAPGGPVLRRLALRQGPDLGRTGGLHQRSVGEHVGEGRHRAHRQQGGQQVGDAATAAAGGANQGRVGQHHHEADHRQHEQPRHQWPELEAGIPDGPDTGEQQDDGVQPGT